MRVKMILLDDMKGLLRFVNKLWDSTSPTIHSCCGNLWCCGQNELGTLSNSQYTLWHWRILQH